MSKQNQSFHPRLLINEHFSNLINQIDVKTETLLENQLLTQENRNFLNETREKQIEKIKGIEKNMVEWDKGKVFAAYPAVRGSSLDFPKSL